MIAYERGPFKLFERLRAKAGVLRYDNGEIDYDLSTGELAQFLLCVWCLSLWIAGLWILWYSFFPMPTMIASYVLALSAGAIIAERINHG